MPTGVYPRKPSEPRLCSVDGCGRVHAGRGFCRTHYGRWLKWGDPHAVRPFGRTSPVSLTERIWAKIAKVDGCWIWQGALGTGTGYAVLSVGNRNTYVHRLIYELLVEPIPAGFQVDHLCRNRRCVNPSHLEPVTQQENNRRAQAYRASLITHCPYGHPYDEQNTYVLRGSRRCKACNTRKSRERKRLGTCDVTNPARPYDSCNRGVAGGQGCALYGWSAGRSDGSYGPSPASGRP